MSEQGARPALLSAKAIEAIPERRYDHPFNPNGSRQTKSLGDACGLAQIGVHLVRLLPGRESTEYHTHRHDEEWVYILSGRGVAEIGPQRHAVGPGDFMGFVAGSQPHSMINEGPEDLVYLVGGTRHAWDVVDYVRRGIRAYKYEGTQDNVDVRKLGVDKVR